MRGYYELAEVESSEDPQNLRFWDLPPQKNIVFKGFESCNCKGALGYVNLFEKREKNEKCY